MLPIIMALFAWLIGWLLVWTKGRRRAIPLGVGDEPRTAAGELRKASQSEKGLWFAVFGLLLVALAISAGSVFGESPPDPSAQAFLQTFDEVSALAGDNAQLRGTVVGDESQDWLYISEPPSEIVIQLEGGTLNALHAFVFGEPSGYERTSLRPGSEVFVTGLVGAYTDGSLFMEVPQIYASIERYRSFTTTSQWLEQVGFGLSIFALLFLIQRLFFGRRQPLGATRS